MPRPKKDAKPLNIKLDASIHEKLEQYCRETGANKTITVEIILKQYLSKCFPETLENVSFLHRRSYEEVNVLTNIPDSFTGYLNIGKDTYAFSVSGHVVTLLPANSDPRERSDIFARLEKHNAGEKEILYGKSGIDNVALMYHGKANRGSLNLSPSAKFLTSLIIKSAGNCFDHYARLTDRWDKYHAITFFGGNINPIFNPRIAIIGQKLQDLVRADGAREIKIRPFEDYTQEVKLNIGGEEASLTLSIAQGGEGNDAEKDGAYNLGLLNSFIRITFKTAKGPEAIPEYYRILHELISILTRQNNARLA